MPKDTAWNERDFYEEQRLIEADAMTRGVRRERAAMDRAQAKEREAQTAVGAAMVKRIVGPMEALYRADLDARASGKATKGGSLLRVLKDLDATVVCAAAARAALNRMSRPTKLTALAARIGEALEDELRWHRWEKINKRQAEEVRKRVNQSRSPHQRRAALAGFARRWERKALAEAWTKHRTVGIGIRFIDYLVQLGVFEMTKIASRSMVKKSAAHAVRLTAQAAEWAKDMGDFLAISRPLSWPLVIPPVPWTGTSGGGFHFREGIFHPSMPMALRPLNLVRRASKEQRAMLAKADLSTVYAGVNAAQATAWRINPRVYGVMRKLMERGTDAPGITALDPREVPGRLSDEEAADKEGLIAHKNEIRKAKTANAKMISKRFAQHRVFATADRFVSYPAIYFAYNLDFRGRVYACSDDLSPQGNDLQRGLLEFAEGDPLDAEGLRWLRVHLANTYGVDKVSFRERERWAEKHYEMILACADDPMECEEWHAADQPWQFLAACFAFADYSQDAHAVVRVPVMLDGSCSGIQHYAAILRDEDAGREVNLVPGDKPGDLYRVVADRIMEKLKTMPAEVWEGSGKAKKRVKTFAAEWRSFGIDRKITKRSVMVLPYGGTFLSNLDYVRDAVRDQVESRGVPSWLTEDNEQEAYVALAKIVWAAMHDVVKGPIEGMKYVRRVVKTWAREAPTKKLHWTSPCGFPVVSDYHKAKLEPVKVDAATTRLKVSVTVPPLPSLAIRSMFTVPTCEPLGVPLKVRPTDFTTETDWNRVETSAAPNFVHSLDASHLLLSLKRASVEGITQLATVHDAFGTTPTKTAAFARILAEEFAKLYIADPFTCLQEPLKAMGVEPPVVPPRGALSVEAIATSPYLFA